MVFQVLSPSFEASLVFFERSSCSIFGFYFCDDTWDLSQFCRTLWNINCYSNLTNRKACDASILLGGRILGLLVLKMWFVWSFWIKDRIWSLIVVLVLSICLLESYFVHSEWVGLRGPQITHFRLTGLTSNCVFIAFVCDWLIISHTSTKKKG